ncbi:hypothetical protein [Actinocorallia libanotica]|uniref:Uncharacterized protein n=1 Tax=Actinocorallia libanotica TaxID=46162 RepID=A0ABN1RHW4_9ACTN
MDRRTDRAIGLVTLLAVALVPTAFLTLGKVGDGFDAGRSSETAVTPISENYPGAPPPLPPAEKPLQINLPQMPPGSVPVQPPAQTDPPESKPLPAELTSFTRQIGTAVIEQTGSTSTQELAKFTLKPKFEMDATSTDYVLKGKKWKKTGATRIVIRNRVKVTKAPDGEITREKLTPEEIDQLRYEADPRTLTHNVQQLPGVKKTYDKKTKLYQYKLNLTAGSTIIEKLPPGIQEHVPDIAALLGLQVELYADAKDHAIYASLNGVTVVNATGIGVIYSDMK